MNGALRGVKLELLWECVAAETLLSRTRCEQIAPKKTRLPLFENFGARSRSSLANLVQLFDELGIKKLDDHKEQKPLWNLATIDPKAFDGLPVDFKMSEKLLEIRSQMLGETALSSVADSERCQSRSSALSGGRGSLARTAPPHVS